MEKIRLHIYFSGRVQRVGYRSYVRRKALSIGVLGWVRNLNDGRVEVMAEGDEDSVYELLEACRKGPPSSRVTSIKVSREMPTEEFASFVVLH